ncbi:D-alanyl-D-alanine carboxypeptidase [Aminobacter sp. HY435]|uniref:D-alanyl-D-alanine carboxypeptidase n=1 Tax=Aminobacter sp. HY435 TaxID=2970917 RepID=UPI0022B96A54|nr:D-alanyl-D-alanine carboxypeptidase [Aminobacter sp. HY435]
MKKAISIKSLVVFTLATALGLTSVAPALAAKDSKYAAIVIDANTGKTLHSSNADSRRYPASLTKMMTLYMTFEAMAQGKINKNTPVVFSKNAAAEPPTKIGVKAGGSISVEAAILSLVTRSANDAATALGEMIGGSEENFTRMMTARARSLGMKGTVFRNAHGLPNTGQFTTARDMATLGIALREHFPQYYSYFSTRSFAFGRQRIANHNRLLGRIKGVDGIKTGYTRASGFNLVSSVQDGNRNLVAVVMGGTSGASRDNQMASLIKTYLPQASRRGGGGDLIAKVESNLPEITTAKVQLPKRDVPTPAMRPQADVIEVAEVATQDDIAAVVASAAPSPKPVISAKPQPKIAMASAERFGGPIPFRIRKPKEAIPATAAEAVEQAYAAPEESPAIDAIKTASIPSGWAVQVASSPSDGEARAILDKTAKQAPQVLASASAYTVPFEKGGVTYYRARFAGFDSKDAAWSACNSLKKKKISCYAIAQ